MFHNILIKIKKNIVDYESKSAIIKYLWFIIVSLLLFILLYEKIIIIDRILILGIGILISLIFWGVKRLPAYLFTNIIVVGLFIIDGFTYKHSQPEYLNFIIGLIGLNIFIYSLRLNHTKNKEISIQLEKVEELRREAMHQSNLKTIFLSTISHEIRNPISILVGILDLLENSKPLTKDQLYQIQLGKSASQTVLTVLNDILEFGRLETDNVKVETIPFQLFKVVETVTSLFYQRAIEKGLKFTSDISSNITEVLIGDPYRLQQILINLIGNAIKFTDHGEILLKVEVINKTVPSYLLLFSVMDTGVGIPLDKVKKIFEPFEQAETSTARQYGGSGMGMAITKKLVELLRGGIWVESEVGVGSTFRVTLEFNISPVSTALEAIEKKMSTDLPHTEKIRNKSILFVDDADEFRYIAKMYLKNIPCQVSIAVNGLEALKMFKSKTYDLVLMDVSMPVMNGIESVKKMRDWEKQIMRDQTPIIAMTGHAQIEEIQSFLDAGYTKQLTKPFDKEALYSLIDEYISDSVENAWDENELLNLDITINPELVHMIPYFIKNREKDLQDFMVLSEMGDFEEMSRLAHKIKGVCANYGFNALTSLSKQIENDIKEKSTVEIVHALDEFSRNLSNLKKQLKLS